MEYNELETLLDAKFTPIYLRLNQIEEHLCTQNGRLSKCEGQIQDNREKLLILNTLDQYSSKELTRLNQEQKETSNRVIDLIKQSGAWVMSLLLILNMLGNWLGWFE